MKRLVLGSAALVAANLIAGHASAEPLQVRPFIDLVVGLYANDSDAASRLIVDANNNPVGDGTSDDHFTVKSFQSLAVKSDGELGFRISQKMDNDYQLSAKVRWDLDLELDEYNIALRGGFGKFVFGGDDTAAKNMHYTVPHFVPGGEITSLDSPDIRPLARVSSDTTTFIEITGDSNKLSYYTPRIQGLKVGLSYIPDADEMGQADQRNLSEADSGFESLYTLSANYHRQVAGGLLGVSYGYMSGAGPDGDPAAMSAGINFKIKKWTLGGAWFSGDNLSLDSDNDEHARWAVGLAYGVGPWTVGAAYLSSETDIAGTIIETSVIQVGTVYELGQNLNAGFDLQFIRDDDPRSLLTQTDKVDGYSVGFLLSASF